MEKLATELTQIIRADFQLEIEPELSRPEPQFGDFTTNVALRLAKDSGRSPRDIAETLAEKVRAIDGVVGVDVAGPGFVNIRLSDAALFELASQPDTISTESTTIVIETNNPNPFKAMHIGHAFNAILADTLANLLEKGGHSVHRVSYHGDVGLHVGKSMYVILRHIDNQPERLSEVPESERNAFMSQMYAEGARAYKEDESAKAEIEELTKRSFTRDEAVFAAVYETISAWSFEQIDAVVARLGNKPVERRFLESDAELRGVKIVKDNTPDVFQQSDGAYIFKGSEHGSFDNAFVSSRGTGLYGARDLGLIQLKNEQYHPVKSYIVTAEEQRDYFKGVLAAASLCFKETKGETINIPTGTVKLSSGKMSSREGDVVEIAWLFDQIGEAVKARGGEPIDAVVAGALRYAFLRVRIGGDVVFDVNEAVSLQGNSGPYLQYAHARACSILEKAGDLPVSSQGMTFDDSERALLRKIGEGGEVVSRAVDELLPHYVCNYLYELAQEFNRFYEKCRIIGDERQATRLELVKLYRAQLASGLELLGIEAPERL